MDQLFTPGQPDKHPYAVGEQRAVGVTPVLEVDHDQKLGEQDDVDQVRAHGPVEVKFRQKLDFWIIAHFLQQKQKALTYSSLTDTKFHVHIDVIVDGVHSVWSDVGIKSSPIFTKRRPKSSQSSFNTFQNSPKKLPNIWAAFARKIVTKTSHKYSNLVTLFYSLTSLLNYQSP